MECLQHSAHRPYPMLNGRASWRQRWLDLAFFHWPVPADLVSKYLPEGLELDLFEGQAWLSVVPFRIEDVMLRGLPAVPTLSNFPELNLRTYVKRDGKPGVWFFSLDADQSLAVWAARKFFHLPYYKASMCCSASLGGFDYRSERESDGAVFEASYRPVGEVYYAEAGTLEYWLTERYCLYAVNQGGGVYRGEIHHKPWPLQEVEFSIGVNEIGLKDGFDLSTPPVLAQFARSLDVAVWDLRSC